MCQPKLSGGVQGRDVKPSKEQELSWIWRAGMREGKKKKKEAAKGNQPQDPTEMLANDSHFNSGQFAKNVSLFLELCSMVDFHPLVLLVFHLPSPVFQAAHTPTYHAQ